MPDSVYIFSNVWKELSDKYTENTSILKKRFGIWEGRIDNND